MEEPCGIVVILYGDRSREVVDVVSEANFVKSPYTMAGSPRFINGDLLDASCSVDQQ